LYGDAAQDYALVAIARDAAAVSVKRREEDGIESTNGVQGRTTRKRVYKVFPGGGSRPSSGEEKEWGVPFPKLGRNLPHDSGGRDTGAAGGALRIVDNDGVLRPAEVVR
jgi:hypothetical protein